ncbi:MAG: FtsX-like permease family protein [Bacteroidales bacterium]|nr:FtsX-like permease family protein [Clostridium sp.]MCM1202957.1 FtsX-like permease family protein [Bacteroidales bacterium]
MQKVLRKRIFRDLKENAFRYLALGLLVILGMYMIISLVGAADTIITGTADAAKANKLEDGQFSLFVPLTKEEKSALEKDGITLESHFYLDYSMEDDSVLRIFSERNEIDLPQADFGRLPQKSGEIFLEKRYCEEQGISVDDEIMAGGRSFRVCGIGTSPDYDTPYRNLSDSAVDSELFGVGFLLDEDYRRLKEEKKSIRSEEYVYAYLLNGKLTQEELKEKLQKMDIEAEDIDDAYFQEYWERTGGKLDAFKEALDELSDGAVELQKGLDELNDNSGKLTDGASEIFDAYLAEASESLANFGVSELNGDNYQTVMEKMIANSNNALVQMSLKSALEQLEELDAFAKGMTEYAGGVSEAAEGSEKLSDGVSEFSEETEEFLDEHYHVELSKLTQFVKAEDNTRIGGAADDQFINKAAGLAAGVIVLILFAYVISVFVVHSIEQEAGIIGTLYAMGVRKNELLRHYLALPVGITFLAGVIGTALGYSDLGVQVQMRDCYGYYSVPALDVIYEPYLLVYGIVMPPVAAALTNFLVIRKKLERPALSLIRNEQKNGKTQNIQIRRGSFVHIFQIRQMLRERRTAFTVFFGMFISLLIVMLSLNCYALCGHIKTENRADTRFAYMYTYKYPEKQVPEGGEAAYGVTLKKEVLGYNLDVTLLGIDSDNPYFEIQKTEGEESFSGKNKVQISSAMAQKYHLDTGDDLVLKDEENDRNYAFTIEAVVPYSTSFFAFMDIDSMRELMGEDGDYYNIVFADHALDIDSGRIYSAASKEEIEKSASIFVEMMMPMVVTMAAASAFIFAVVMYLMMKVMIDRSAMSISLMKVFGYRKGEVRKLYLNGNLLIVVVSALLGIPLSKVIMDSMYPYLVSNVASGINLTYSWQMYIGLFGVIIILYFIINRILMRRVNKIMPAEVLKNRE